ncbi:MAG: oligosaccharide flippase family protein [Nanoarchaeota archaeon]
MIKKIFSNELVKGSLVLFVTFNIFNVLNFIFQFSMARMLGPSDFGILASIMTLLYFLALPSESIQTVVSRYTSKFKVENNDGKIKNLLFKSLKNGLFAALVLFLVLMPLFFAFGYFLNIPFSVVALCGLMLFPFLLIPATRGVMQGMKKFNALGWNMIFDSSIKVIAAILLVYLGFGIYAAVGSIIIGGLAALSISFIPLKKVIKSKSEKADFSGIYKYGSPIIIVLLPVLLMQSIDVFLARRFFSAEIAGHYAVANLIGKMIFFGTLAIAKTMFPISSEKFEDSGKDNEKTRKIFYKSLIMVLGLCFSALIILLLFPSLLISLLFGKEYLEITGIVFNIGIAFTFISLANIFLLYGISINRKINIKFMSLFVILVIFQGFLLWFLRDSLWNFSIGMIISSLLLFIGSLFVVRRKG